MPTPDTTTSRRQLRVTLCEVRHAHSAKENKDWHFAKAEIPNEYPGAIWSTMRLSCTSTDEPFPSDWKEGATVTVHVSQFDVVEGNGKFRPL